MFLFLMEPNTSSGVCYIFQVTSKVTFVLSERHLNQSYVRNINVHTPNNSEGGYALITCKKGTVSSYPVLFSPLIFHLCIIQHVLVIIRCCRV